MLTTIGALIDHLNAAEIRYCHWKSNWTLDETLAGRTDLDLLISRDDARRFRRILEEHGFCPAIETGVQPLPSVAHYHAFDEDGGSLVHVHAYYRVITGESLAKNYRFPVEEMLLRDSRWEGTVKVPKRGAELIIFVLRMLLKHTTLIELVLLARDWQHVRKEVAWLMTDEACAEAAKLLPEWFPDLGMPLFQAGAEALRVPAPLWRRIVLGYRLRSRLDIYARRKAVRARLTALQRIIPMAFHRLIGSKKGLTPAGGGAVIAFVGSEATGKSTLLKEIAQWLGGHYTVKRIHAGKPPGTAITLVPNLFIPALRKRLPKERSSQVEIRYAGDADSGSIDEHFPLLFGIRSVLLAHDRRSLLARAFAHSANGTIVLSDRYPSVTSGTPDSAQLSHLDWRGSTLRRRLVSLEARLYRDIPPPDLVIYLTAPLDVTLARNMGRAKTEPTDYVRYRHALTSRQQFEGTQVHRIETNRPLEDILRELKRVIWEAL